MAWSSRRSLVLLLSSCVAFPACGDDGDDGASSTTFSSLGDETAESAAEAADATSDGGGTEADAGDGDTGAETEGGDGDTGADTEAEAEADGGDGDAGADGSLSCEECWMTNCSSERSACEGETDCACILTCVEGGGSPGQCKSECGVQGSNEPYNAWQECIDLNCAGAC